MRQETTIDEGPKRQVNALALTCGVLAGTVVLVLTGGSWPAGQGEDALPAASGEPVSAAKENSRSNIDRRNEGTKAGAEPIKEAEAVPDPAVVRRKAWNRIAGRLPSADAASAAEIDRCLGEIDDFFSGRRGGIRPFAESTLSFKGKWRYIRSKLPTAEGGEHLRYLDEKFAEHVFRTEELKGAIEAAIREYVQSVQAIENRLLVECRADIRQSQPNAGEVIAAVRSEEVFSREYRQMLERVLDDVSRDLNIDLSREVVSLVGGEIAALVSVRVGAAVAAKLGVDAGILAAGAASSWGTFGLGLAAAIVVDVALDWAMKMAGHDPVGKVAEKVSGTLENLRSLLIDGDPEALADFEKLSRLAASDPDEKVRKLCKRAATAIERSGSLGLRRELWRLHEQRARLRDEAIRSMILESGNG